MVQRIRSYDVVVIGAGYAGFACALRLVAAGKRVLLSARDAGLLWESGRSGARVTTLGADVAWRRFADEVATRSGVRSEVMPAIAEIVATRWVMDELPGLEVRYFAWPVGERSADEAAGRVVTFAGKGGLFDVQAKTWVDATERGELLRACGRGYSLPERAPGRSTVNATYLVAGDGPTIEDGLGEVDGVQVRWRAPRAGLIAVEAVVPGGFDWWNPAQRVALLSGMARVVGADGAGCSLAHVGSQPFPCYAGERRAEPVRELRGNWIVASPALLEGAVGSVEDRVELGQAAARAVLDPGAFPVVEGSAVTAPPMERAGVAVCGAGVSGAIAALAAADTGAGVVCIEPTSSLGGVGTHGFINGYCAGSKTGWFQRIDARGAEISRLIGASPPRIEAGAIQGWHYLGRETALEEAFAERGIRVWRDSFVCGVRAADGRVLAIRAATPSGLAEIAIDACVDCSGDGDVAVLAGAAALPPGRVDGLPLAYTQNALVLYDRDGRTLFTNANYDAGWVDATDGEDLTRARLEGVRQHLRDRYVEFWPVAVSPIVGVRQSRHIETDVVVEMADLVEGRRFADAVGVAETYLDTHASDLENEPAEALFWWWVCQSFFQPIGCALPYRMLLPRGLSNLWVAGRCAGISPVAANGLRMQRDMQRLGEAAGTAAALFAVERHADSRSIAADEIRRRMHARHPLEEDPPSGVVGDVDLAEAAALEALRDGKPRGVLWALYRRGDRVRPHLLEALASPDRQVSWLAACVLAALGDGRAEMRLIDALRRREPRDASRDSVHGAGAFDQEILLPNWLLALVLLRFCGSPSCLDAIEDVLQREARAWFPIRLMIATTLEGLVRRGVVGEGPRLDAALSALLRDLPPDRVAAPLQSLARALRGEPPKRLYNERGARILHDLTWQLWLTIARIRRRLGGRDEALEAQLKADARAYVRRAIERLPTP